jgi:hypothetical protein
MVSQSNFIEARRADGRCRLSIQIIDDDTKRIVGLLEPMGLYGSEVQLRGGRLHAYDPTISTLAISFAPPNSGINQSFINMVEWIADHAEGRWSFSVRTEGTGFRLTFYFDDAQDAMLFRLSIN